MTEGYVANGAKVYIVGRRGDVLDKTVKEIRAEHSEKSGRSGGIGEVHA